jgi:glycosyltransferase involved in cell wall biosynthesis
VEEATAGVRVLYVQYTDPAAYPPLEHGAWLLAEAGCEVHFAGVDLTQGRIGLSPHPRVSVSLMRPEAPGWRQKLQFLRFVWWTLGEARRWKPAWVYASDTLATPAALALCRLTGAQVIYHEHDAPTGRSASVFMRLARACRRQLVRRASVLIVPSRERARYLDGGSDDATIVSNTPLRREVRERRDASASTIQLRALYHGSIVPARLPLAIVDALAELPAGVTLTVAGYDPTGSGHLASLIARADARGVGHRLHVAGLVPTRRALLDLAASCDVGISFMPSATQDPNEQTMVGASNKPFDYLACGLALLVSDVPAWREMYVTPGYGLACIPESVSSIASTLRWFLTHPGERTRMGEAGRQRVLTDWHYEREFLPVVRRIVGHEVTANEPAAVAKATASA